MGRRHEVEKKRVLEEKEREYLKSVVQGLRNGTIKHLNRYTRWALLDKELWK